MIRDRTIPKSKEHWLQLRSKVLTSTELSALFGINPYVSLFELWHRKRTGETAQTLRGEWLRTGDLGVIDQTERMYWGSMLEMPIALEWATRNGQTVGKNTEFGFLPEHKIGSSYDYITSDGSTLVECKNVDSLVYSRDWTEDEAPPHIEMQAQIQMLVSGVERLFIAVLVGGNKYVQLERAIDKEVCDAAVQAAEDFWLTIESGEEPEPNESTDVEFMIKKLYANASGETIDSCQRVDQLVEAYRAVSDRLKPLEGEKRKLKAQILEAIGTASKVQGEQYTISSGMVKPSVVPAFERKGFRNFRVSWKRGAK